MKNPPVFLTEINSSHKLLFLTKIRGLQIFDKETTTL